MKTYTAITVMRSSIAAGSADVRSCNAPCVYVHQNKLTPVILTQ